MKSSTAILLFARTAADEANHKQFTSIKNHKVNTYLANAQLKLARSTALSTEYSVIEVDSTQQIGDSFGERLSNAVNLVFAKGFERVVIIGSDCLTLTANDICQAAKGLQNDDLVVGPNNRGGAYLIGFTKSFFNLNHFKSLAWETSFLLSQFIDQDAFLLAVKSDYNVRQDVFGFSNTTKVFLQRLLNVFNTCSEVVKSVIGIFNAFVFSTNYFRGPPFLFELK